MLIKIKNKTKHLHIIPTNNNPLYLAPGESSNYLDRTEIMGNEKIVKLHGLNQIAIVAESAVPRPMEDEKIDKKPAEELKSQLSDEGEKKVAEESGEASTRSETVAENSDRELSESEDENDRASERNKPLAKIREKLKKKS